MTAFSLNSPQGKALLALARDGDYAHPGEAEAIRLACAGLARQDSHRLLDVGCGRGGTAAWFQARGWGTVTGVDLDAQSIAFARQRYPSVHFLAGDATRLDTLGLPPFDLVYLFTGLYAFADQPAALRQMRQVCRPGGRLLMVEYMRPLAAPLPPGLGTEIGQPLVPAKLAGVLAAAGWQLESLEDWTPHFIRWYANLLQRFHDRKAGMLALAGAEAHGFVTRWYAELLAALQSGQLGGARILARAGPCMPAAGYAPARAV